MPLTSNTTGQMYALTVFAPVVADRLAELRTALEGLSREASPFARLGTTHFARWVIVADFVSDSRQPGPEHLPCPYLLFSATFDGKLDPYLDALCGQHASDAEPIWGCCVGAPQPARGEPLKAYLKHNQIQTGLFFSAYPDASVATVTAALATRERTIAFATRSQGMTPAAFRQAFLEEFAP